MALVQILCANSAGRIERALFILFSIVFLWLHGSKGHILNVSTPEAVKAYIRGLRLR